MDTSALLSPIPTTESSSSTLSTGTQGSSGSSSSQDQSVSSTQGSSSSSQTLSANNEGSSGNNHGSANSNKDCIDDFICAITAQIDEIERFDSRGKHDASNDDLKTALDVFDEEHRQLLNSLKLAKAMESCGNVDDNLMQSFQRQDDLERQDRGIAVQLSRGRTATASRLYNTGITLRPSQQALLKKENQPPTNQGSSSSSSVKAPPSVSASASASASSASLKAQTPPTECVSCLEMTGTQKVPCGHSYCGTCLGQLCKSSLSDRKFVPIRCCKISLPEPLVKAHFSSNDWTKYSGFLNEMNNPQPSTKKLDEVMTQTIKEHGWKVCPKCGAVVERKDGCVHITCLCRYEFCYTCLKKWFGPSGSSRTCTCELYPPAELEVILNERAGRVGGLDQAAFDARREGLRNVLNNYYDHVHKWRYIPRSNRCDNCNWFSDKFIMHCHGCDEYRCRRCINNL